MSTPSLHSHHKSSFSKKEKLLSQKLTDKLHFLKDQSGFTARSAKFSFRGYINLV